MLSLMRGVVILGLLFGLVCQAADEAGWETRSIVGLQQAAGAAADPRLTYFVDFFIVRPLGNQLDARLNRHNIWGNVRLASVPQQLNTPLSQFLKDAAKTATSTKIDQLVQSAEFTTGYEYRLKIFRSGGRIRSLGVVGEFSATGPLSPQDSATRVFQVPAKDSPARTAFAAIYGSVPATANVVFANPDRQQFFKRHGVGLRVSTYDAVQAANPPGTYTVTIGQDEVVTGGRLSSAVAHFDVFYPLPVAVGGLKFLYLFGTATTRLYGARDYPPMFLSPVDNVPLSDPGVTVMPVRGTRDVYRVGVGVDVLAVLGHIKVTTK
jgi:hypothetical protein